MASFPEEIPGDDLIRAFTLTGADRDLVAIRGGGQQTALGLALQLCALRYLGSPHLQTINQGVGPFYSIGVGPFYVVKAIAGLFPEVNATVR